MTRDQLLIMKVEWEWEKVCHPWLRNHNNCSCIEDVKASLTRKEVFHDERPFWSKVFVWPSNVELYIGQVDGTDWRVLFWNQTHKRKGDHSGRCTQLECVDNILSSSKCGRVSHPTKDQNPLTRGWVIQSGKITVAPIYQREKVWRISTCGYYYSTVPK
jgi:hypothetical protein